MPDYSLIPVDYQPNFDGYSLVPVDYDPFAADGATQQAQIQQAQPQGPPQQQPATGAGQPDAGAPAAGGGPSGSEGGGIGPTGDAPNPSWDQGAAKAAPFGGYSLVPVDYQPDFDGYYPFAADGLTQQAQFQQPPTPTQPAPPQPQQPATGVGQPGFGAPPIGDGSAGSYDGGGYVPGGGLYSPGSGGRLGIGIQDADFVIPDSGPTVPTHEQVSTGAEAAQGFANVFNINGGAGYPTIGDASFGAVAQSNTGIIAAGSSSITSTRGITAYDGNTLMYFEPTNDSGSITVSIDSATHSITVVQNPGRRA
jgi:hypothetical protein